MTNSGLARPTSKGTRVLIALGLTGSYAVCFASIRVGLGFAPPFRFAALRAFLGGTALLAFAYAQSHPVLPHREHWPWLLGLAATATTLSFGAMFLSPGFTSSGVASVLGNTQSLIVMVLAWLFLGESMTIGKLMSLLIGLAGVVLIAYPALIGSGAYGFSGAALAVAASGGAAAGSIIVKRADFRSDLLTITAWQLVLGSLPLGVISTILEANEPTLWRLEFIGLLLFLALVGTSITTAVWYWLIQKEDVGRLSLLLFLVPVFGLAIGTLVLEETIGPLEVIGAVLTMVGVGVAIRQP
ncbi:MAG: DMT family transporter [Anaerolineae bacterium]